MWAGTSTYRVGSILLGVRSSTAGVHELLRRALAAHLVEDVDAPANLSLRVDPPRTGREQTKGFHFLYAHAAQVVRTRDPRRLVRCLLTYLSAGIEEETPHLRLHARALVRDGRAVLVPAAVGPWLPLVERRLTTRGFRVVDAPWAWVDADRGELVVPAPSLQVDWSALDAVGEVAARSGPPDPGVDYGTYPLGGWAFRAPDGAVGPMSPAHAVLLAATAAYDRDRRGAGRVLRELATIVGCMDPVGVAWTDGPGLVGAIDSVPVRAGA